MGKKKAKKNTEEASMSLSEDINEVEKLKKNNKITKKKENHQNYKMHL